MYVHIVQLAEHPGWIGELAGELVRSHALHPVKIEDQVVERNLKLAIFRRDVEHFLLGLILEARLPETISPSWEQGRSTGQRAVVGDDVVEVRAVEKVIVDGIGDISAQRQLGLEM